MYSLPFASKLANSSPCSRRRPKIYLKDEVVNEVNALRGDPSSEEDGILSFLKPIVPDLARVLLERGTIPASAGGAPAGASAPASALPYSPAAGPTVHDPQVLTESGTTENVTEEQFEAVKKQALAYALSMARLGRSPTLYAEMTVETVDLQGDPVTARLIQEAVGAESFDAWFTSLQALEPALITQRDWFLEFFETLREAVATENHPEAESGEKG